MTDQGDVDYERRMLQFAERQAKASEATFTLLIVLTGLLVVGAFFLAMQL